MNGSELLRFVVEQVADLCRQHPDWSADQVARAYLPQAHAEVGGDSYYVPKHAPSAQEEARQALVRDAMGPATTRELQERHHVSRATIYRLMKRAPKP